MTDKCPYMNWKEDPKDRYEEEGISLRELLLVLIRGKKTLIWITVIVFLVTMAGAVIIPKINIGTQGTVQTAVQLYFSGIEVGQTPTGGNYDVNEIKAADVLQSAIDNIDFGNQRISLEKLRSNISFQAVVPDSVAKTLEILKNINNDQIKIEKLEALSGYSDIFIVRLNLASDLGLNEEQGRMLLDGIILEYKERLIDKYGDNAVLANIFASDLKLDEYDYIQAAEILNGQLERMELYVNHHMLQTEIHSTVTGLNPVDIRTALTSIRNVDMEWIYSMIGAYYLTKDPAKVVALYEQMAEDKENAAAQYKEQAEAIKAAIMNFKKGEPTVVLGDMGEAPINLSSEDPEYNKLVTQYIEIGTLASSAAEDGRYYRSEAERFRTAIPLNRENSVKAAQVGDTIALLREKLINWTAVINETAQDYYSEATYQHYAEQLMPSRIYANLEEGLNLPLTAAIGLVLGLVLGVLAVLFRAYMKEDYYHQERKVTADEKAE